MINCFERLVDPIWAKVDAKYRALGVRVVAGGPHVSYWPEEALQHVDAVVMGEAEGVWLELLRDAECSSLQQVYRGSPADMNGLPMSRYDLLEKRFVVPRVIQATRGRPFRCSFCSVPGLNPGYRVRPVEDVLRDVADSRFPHFWQEKVAWFWDDNLLIQRRWAKELLRGMAGLNRWWLTQASIASSPGKPVKCGWSRLRIAASFTVQSECDSRAVGPEGPGAVA